MGLSKYLRLQVVSQIMKRPITTAEILLAYGSIGLPREDRTYFKLW